MPFVFTGRQLPAGQFLTKANPAAALGLPHDVIAQPNVPTFRSGYLHPATQFPAKFPKAIAGALHWQVKTLKVNGTVEGDDGLGGTITDTITNLVMGHTRAVDWTTGPRIDPNQGESVGFLGKRDYVPQFHDATGSNTQLDLYIGYSFLGGGYYYYDEANTNEGYADLWIDQDGDFWPRLQFDASDGLFFGMTTRKDDTHDTLAGTVTILGVEIPMWKPSGDLSTITLEIDINESFDYNP